MFENHELLSQKKEFSPLFHAKFRVTPTLSSQGKCTWIPLNILHLACKQFDSFQFKLICIALFTILIVSKQIYRKCLVQCYNIGSILSEMSVSK